MTQVKDKAITTTSTSATVLDIEITKKRDIILSHNVVSLGIADHDLDSVVINVLSPEVVSDPNSR